MTTKIKIIVIAASVIIAFGGGMLAGFFAFRCEPGIVQTGKPGPLSPTTWTDDAPDAKYCGDKIDIIGAMRQGSFFVTAWDSCKYNSREFPMAAECAVTYRPYSIQIQLFMLAGYNNEIQKMNVLAGGTIAFLRNYRYGSIGVGLTYAQGIIIPEYYAGVSVIGQIDFGKKL